MDHLLSMEKELRKVTKTKCFCLVLRNRKIAQKMIFENWILIHDLSLKIAR